MTISDRANSIENQLPEENPSNDMPQEFVAIITISINVFVNACLEAWAQRANVSARRLEWDNLRLFSENYGFRHLHNHYLETKITKRLQVRLKCLP